MNSSQGPTKHPAPSGPPPWFKDVPGKVQITIYVYAPGDPGYQEAQQRFSSVKRYLDNFPRFSGGDEHDIEWVDPFLGQKHCIPLGNWATNDPEHTHVDLRSRFTPERNSE